MTCACDYFINKLARTVRQDVKSDWPGLKMGSMISYCVALSNILKLDFRVTHLIKVLRIRGGNIYKAFGTEIGIQNVSFFQ